MEINDLLDMVSKKKIKTARAQAAEKFFTGMGILVTAGACVATGALFATEKGKEVQKSMKTRAEAVAETIMDTAQKRAESMKDGAARATEEVRRVIEDVDERMKRVKEALKRGSEDK